MKKLVILFITMIFVMTSLYTNGQVASNSSGLISTYQDVERAYIAQVQGGEMTKKEEEDRLNRLTPEVKTKMEEIKKLNKNMYNQLLRSAFPFGVTRNDSGELVDVGLFNANESQKKEKELEIDTELLALKYKMADSNSKQKMKNDLTNTLSLLFDIKEANKEREVKRLEQGLQDLKESLQARKQNKNEIIQRKIQELLGDSKYLRWE